MPIATAIMPLIDYPQISYPTMLRLYQKFPRVVLDNIPMQVTEQLQQLDLQSQVKPGDTIAIAVGSRGITDIVPVVQTIAGELKQLGALPFVVPAMGSHGGASATGQADVLRYLGITERTVGVPIRSNMEVIHVGEINLFGISIPVYLDQYAYNADHIVVVNRIKPHTDFSGAFGSGWRKMLCIGLGNHVGALLYHRVIASYGYANVLEPIAKKVLATGKILCGIGIIENAYRQTAAIVAASSETLLATEVELLKQANSYLAKLPFNEVDLLIVDELGKDISGSGMEPTVHGRLHCLSEPQPKTPTIKRIFVRDLTPASEGNALGIGFADFTTQRLVDKINFKTTYINCITGMDPEDGRIPITLATDQEAIDAALNTIGFTKPDQAKVIWIKNTSSLNSILVSTAYQPAIDAQSHLVLDEILGELTFNAQGNLIEAFSGFPSSN